MEIKIIRSARRTLSIEIDRELRLIARAPLFLSDAEIYKFIEQKSEWIERHIEIQRKRAESIEGSKKFTSEELAELVKAARAAIPLRVAYYADMMGLKHGRISIRKQISRWGSCSAKGNLSFNCLLMLCPSDVLDYVVVHELCHLKEMNHSKRFWQEVRKFCPNFETCRCWLKRSGNKLIFRLKMS